MSIIVGVWRSMDLAILRGIGIFLVVRRMPFLLWVAA
jgi:hypothetical protein